MSWQDFKNNWNDYIRKLDKSIARKRLEQPMFWETIVFMLLIAAFFSGYFVGAVVEHNIAVQQVNDFVAMLPPEAWASVYNVPEAAQQVQMWGFNLTRYINGTG